MAGAAEDPRVELSTTIVVGDPIIELGIDSVTIVATGTDDRVNDNGVEAIPAIVKVLSPCLDAPPTTIELVVNADSETAVNA